MTARPMARLRKLLETLRDYPEVSTFHAELEGFGEVRLQLERPRNEVPIDDNRKKTAEPTPIDWRWGT